MKKVYIAGAMSADNILQMLQNIHDGIKLGGEVLKLGYAPFVPHFDICFKLQQGVDFDVPMQYYYDYTMEWLKASDIVLVCPNWKNSKGTLAEIEKAKELNIPVLYSLNELKIFNYVQEHLFDPITQVQEEIQKIVPGTTIESSCGNITLTIPESIKEINLTIVGQELHII